MLFKTVTREWWLGDRIAQRDITIHKKEIIIEKHILPYFGNMDFQDVTDTEVNLFIEKELKCGNRLNGKGLFINSVIKEVEIVKKILTYGYNKGYVNIDIVC